VKTQLIAIACVVSLWCIIIAHAASYDISASIGNSHMVLYPNVTPGTDTVIEKYIAVNNINPIDVIVSVKPTEEFEQYATVLDPAFVLAPNETRNARFTVTINQPGRYDGKILVSFLPASNPLNASGVGLASNIIIIARNSTIVAPELPPAQSNETTTNPSTDISPKNFGFIILAASALIILVIAIAYSRRNSGGMKNE